MTVVLLCFVLTTDCRLSLPGLGGTLAMGSGGRPGLVARRCSAEPTVAWRPTMRTGCSQLDHPTPGRFALTLVSWGRPGPLIADPQRRENRGVTTAAWYSRA